MAGESKKKKMRGKKYTEAEDKFLMDNYKKMRKKEIAEALGRSVASISGRARLLGFYDSAQAEPEEHDDFIRENYHTMSNDELCRIIGKNEAYLITRVRKLKLKSKRSLVSLTKGERRFLFEECGNYTAAEMANLLKKNEKYIRALVKKNGLKFKPARGHTEAQLEFVRENYPTMDTEELMKVLGIKNAHTIHYMAKKMNVRKLSPGKDGKKICRNCNRILPLGEFRKVKGSRYHHTCKLCEHDKKLKKMFEETEGNVEKTRWDKAKETWEAAVARGDTKVCSLCKKELPVSEFYYGKGKCKKCFNTSLKESRLENIKKRGY